MNRRFLLSIIMMILLSVCVQAFEISDGLIKIVFHENTGRFTLYYLQDIDNDEYIPLLLEKDPRTTVLNILVGNKVYTLGDTGSFRQSLIRTDDGGEFLWESAALRVHERLSFIKSAGSAFTDGIKIEISVENISKEEQYVGIRYLFDTWLGEKSKKHFFTDLAGEIVSETDFSDSMPEYWVSPAEPDKDSDEADDYYDTGLQVMVSGAGITKPDRIVFANWSRLNDTSWAFASRSARNFNYLPYSINDSAVCQYYNPVKIPSGETGSFVLAMGNYSPLGFSLSSQRTSASAQNSAGDTGKNAVDETEIAAMTVEELEQFINEEPDLSMEDDLKVISDILARIDELLSGSEELDAEQLEKIQQLINNLKERKNQY